MFDFGWSELLLIGIVALIVVGPKDLPMMFKAMGKFTGKIKAMGREFSRAMHDAADDTGVNDISKSLKAATNPQKFGIDKLREAANISPGSETDKLAKKREAERAAALAQASGSTEGGLTEERAEQAERIRAKTAEAATARQAREAEAAAASEAEAPPAPEAKPE